MLRSQLEGRAPDQFSGVQNAALWDQGQDAVCCSPSVKLRVPDRTRSNGITKALTGKKGTPPKDLPQAGAFSTTLKPERRISTRIPPWVRLRPLLTLFRHETACWEPYYVDPLARARISAHRGVRSLPFDRRRERARGCVSSLREMPSAAPLSKIGKARDFNIPPTPTGLPRAPDSAGTQLGCRSRRCDRWDGRQPGADTPGRAKHATPNAGLPGVSAALPKQR
ncbi:predicted protein [Coccidioides posadasii str. Silveira]|uniref:Predicted protein n=1 Tax=Coccidioides posadasii (strain RMSCC 757 / Silveira) TaxID=443226 RepID=E9D8Q5_COCPS|nr:predicted protein [Coccidioides posadasii str. Silveira]